MLMYVVSLLQEGGLRAQARFCVRRWWNCGLLCWEVVRAIEDGPGKGGAETDDATVALELPQQTVLRLVPYLCANTIKFTNVLGVGWGSQLRVTKPKDILLL